MVDMEVLHPLVLTEGRHEGDGEEPCDEYARMHRHLPDESRTKTGVPYARGEGTGGSSITSSSCEESPNARTISPPGWAEGRGTTACCTTSMLAWPPRIPRMTPTGEPRTGKA